MGCDSGFWSMTIGDLATWFGGVASAAAAFAAWYAARKAIDIAQIPMKEAAEDRERTARTFAPALAEEMGDVQNSALEVVMEIDRAFETGVGNGRAFLNRATFNPMLALAKAMPFIDCFGSDAAAKVISVIAAKGTYDDRVMRLGRLTEETPNYHVELMAAVIDVKGRAQDLREIAGRAYVALHQHIPA